MSKYTAILLSLILSVLGWWLWHHKEADFMSMWTGSMAFFAGILAALVIFFLGPDYVPFG